MFHGCGESLAVYKCANKKVDAHAVYTNTVPSGAFRGYGLSQMIFAIESAMDELAAGIGMDPLEFRRRNMVREGDDMLSTHSEPEEDVHYGSYGLDQCTRLVQDALDRGRERYRAAGLDDLGPDWVTGEGTALSMIDTVPPRGHFAHSKLRLLAGRNVRRPTSGPPNSATAPPRCTRSSRRPHCPRWPPGSRSGSRTRT